ncbi:MAG TPA: hypothetical protein VFN49_06620 [Candidatus Aquilonibacter sp.]|nr:hypothetical protein [Candidatus Aquilonibacter sp.]
MITAAHDYDVAVAALRTQKLPAYVEYVQSSDAHGLAGYHGTPQRIVVDVRAKKIVSESPSGDGRDRGNDSPALKHLIDPNCYRPTGERSARWNGHDAIAISVRATASSCDDLDVHTVFADASTGELLGADGSEDDDGMTVDFSVQYARFGSFVMPTSLSAHAHGHGWLFWARERAEVRYSDYRFTDTRRQATSP